GTTESARRGVVGERSPRREDPARVPSESGDVDEPHAVRDRAERGSHRVDLRGADHDQDRLVAPDAVEHERHGSGEEPIAPLVEQRLVSYPRHTSTLPSEAPGGASSSNPSSARDHGPRERGEGPRGVAPPDIPSLTIASS